MAMPNILCLASSCELQQCPCISDLCVRYAFYWKFENWLYELIRM